MGRRRVARCYRGLGYERKNIMTERHSFLSSIRKSPDDDTPRLVYRRSRFTSAANSSLSGFWYSRAVSAGVECRINF